MDESVRALERDSEAGDLETQTALLAQHLRSGGLSAERLDLLCILDHPPARALRGKDAPRGWTNMVGGGSRNQGWYSLNWVRRLQTCGREVPVRAGVAAARYLAKVRGCTHPAPNLDRVEAWTDDPSNKGLKVLRAAVVLEDDAGHPDPFYAAVESAAVEWVHQKTPKQAMLKAGIRGFMLAAIRLTHPTKADIEYDHSTGKDLNEIHGAVRSALLEWVLKPLGAPASAWESPDPGCYAQPWRANDPDPVDD
ncbi:MAG: hypothetical protein R3F62_21550 [Planctomycetota bacterium]